MGEAGIKNQLIQVILWRSEQQVHVTVQIMVLAYLKRLMLIYLKPFTRVNQMV